MHFPQAVGREQGGADGVAVSHVVVAQAEAIGGEDLLEVLTQRCRFTAQVGTGDGLGGGNQVLVQVGCYLFLL